MWQNDLFYRFCLQQRTKVLQPLVFCDANLFLSYLSFKIGFYNAIFSIYCNHLWRFYWRSPFYIKFSGFRCNAQSIWTLKPSFRTFRRIDIKSCVFDIKKNFLHNVLLVTRNLYWVTEIDHWKVSKNEIQKPEKVDFCEKYQKIDFFWFLSPVFRHLPVVYFSNPI